jgi:hypothetical protein
MLSWKVLWSTAFCETSTPAFVAYAAAIAARRS